ncbi:LOW QUALITY PROTEIN: UPF0764 protein C16orf89 homolog [Alca torda]
MMYVKGVWEEQPSEHELLPQRARIERVVKELSSLTEKVTHCLVLSQIWVLEPVCKKPIQTQRRDMCLFRVCTEMGGKWELHKASTLQLIHCKLFLYLEKITCSEYYKSIFCAIMMKINLEIESNGFKFSSRDLFMGNTVFFCPILFPLVMLHGMSGCLDFYKLRWLEKILTGQKPKAGCFGAPSE